MVTSVTYRHPAMLAKMAITVDHICGGRLDFGMSTGMIAAGRLQAMIKSRASGTSMVQIIAQMDRIIRAIHDSVPEELWEEILHKIDGPVAVDIPTDRIEDCDDADEYGTMLADGNAYTQCARRA
jgi:Luciferase-like monooxygenase